MSALTGALLIVAFAAGPVTAGAQEAGVPTEDTAAATSEPSFFWTDTSVSLLAYGTGFAVDPEEQRPSEGQTPRVPAFTQGSCT